MPKHLALAVVVIAALSPTLAQADAWTDGQAEWARHGFKHGAWDCDGSCPDGRGGRPRPAPARSRMTMACQRNLDDGRTLISDGRLIPDGARTKIVSYRPTRRETGWSYGTCTVDVSR